MSVYLNPLDRITFDRDICFGKPCIRGMRHPVIDLLTMLGSGDTIAEIKAEFPELEDGDFQAVYLYAALCVGKLTDERRRNEERTP